MRPATRLAVVIGLVCLGVGLLYGAFAQSPAARAQTGPTATATRAAYPLPVTPSATSTPTATPRGNRPPTSTPTRPPSPTPTIGFSPLLTGTPTATGPYTVFLPIIMSNPPLAACAPGTDGLGLEPFWPYQAFALVGVNPFRWSIRTTPAAASGCTASAHASSAARAMRSCRTPTAPRSPSRATPTAATARRPASLTAWCRTATERTVSRDLIKACWRSTRPAC